jgi:hypothetical protein
MVKDSPELVIARAEFVVGNLLGLLEHHMGPMVSDDVDDEAKDDLETVICAEFGLLSVFIKDFPRAADEMVPVVSLLLTSGMSEWENIYDSIRAVLLSTFQTETEKFGEIVQVIFGALIEHEHLWASAWCLLEPIQYVLTASSAAFFGLGISEKALELCGTLLATKDVKSSCVVAERLVANIAFVDHTFVPQANDIAARLVSDGGEMFAILGMEIQAATFLATRTVEAEFIETMLFAVGQGHIVTIAQHRLYESALATVACVVPGAADKIIPVVAMLVAREKAKEAEREQIIAQAPEWLVRTRFRQRLPRARRRADNRRGKAELQSGGHRADEDQLPGFLRVNVLERIRELLFPVVPKSSSLKRMVLSPTSSPEKR